jgi:tetratricopeptide (TPR) repeat protein
MDEPDALERADEAIAVAHSLGLPPPVRAFAARGIVLGKSDPAAGNAELRRAIEAADAAGSPRAAASSFLNLAANGYAWFGVPWAVAVCEEGIAYAAAHGVSASFLRATLAESLRLSGDWDRAWAEAWRANDEAAEVGNRKCQFYAANVLADIAVERGQPPADIGWLVEFARGGPESTRDACGLAAAAALLEGRPGDARALLAEGLAAAPGATAGLEYFVRVCLRADEPQLAAEAIEAVARASLFGGLGDQLSQVAARGALAESRGSHAAEGLFGEALELALELGDVIEQAYALAGLGRCLLARGETAQGIARLQDARLIWARLEATPRMAEIDALLGMAH